MKSKRLSDSDCYRKSTRFRKLCHPSQICQIILNCLVLVQLFKGGGGVKNYTQFYQHYKMLYTISHSCIINLILFLTTNSQIISIAVYKQQSEISRPISFILDTWFTDDKKLQSAGNLFLNNMEFCTSIVEYNLNCVSATCTKGGNNFRYIKVCQ